ncbi:MAG: hypothetical protein ACF8QF_10625 [Phycisphaerales bacterium]
MHAASATIVACTILAAGVPAAAQPLVGAFAQPTLDRWVYPFNFTPGQRGSFSTFGALGEPDFDNRDGQVLIGFDTGAQIPTGAGASAYRITSAVVRIGIDQGGFIQYDPTYDAYTTYLDAADPDFVADGDAGRPVELYGAGYRNGFDDATFLETSPFGDTAATYRGVRNVFASDFASGVRRDISNHVDEGFEPVPFAVGQTSLAPGELVPLDEDFVFTIDLGNVDAVAYLQESLDAGRLRLVISSLHPAVQQGGVFASYYAKEALFGGALAARLEIEVTIGSPADLNGDGVVDGADLGLLLGAWGAPGPTDLNGDGATDGADLGLLLGDWG